MIKRPRQHNERHLQFIRGLPCIICLNNTATEAAHIRFSEPLVAKTNPGVGAKPDDMWALPLCGQHHREQHEGSERGWWGWYGIDATKIALALWAHTGNHEVGEQIVRAAHE